MNTENKDEQIKHLLDQLKDAEEEISCLKSQVEGWTQTATRQQTKISTLLEVIKEICKR